MLDLPTNTWIAVPKECAVLWCGGTAEEVTGGKIKAGWHKVEASEKVRICNWSAKIEFSASNNNLV